MPYHPAQCPIASGRPQPFRQASLVAAIVLALLEIGLFASAWRLGALLDPGNDRRAALGFVVLGTALTLQAMAIVGVAWTLVAWSRTTLTIDDDESRCSNIRGVNGAAGGTRSDRRGCSEAG